MRTDLSQHPLRLLLVRTFKPLAGGGPIPPHGLLSVAASVRLGLGERCDIRVMDTGLEQDPAAAMERELRAFTPDAVGFSGMSCEASLLCQLADLARAAAPEALLLAGGPHATVAGERLLADAPLDLVVQGEGEVTAVELFKAVLDGAPLESVPGLLLRGDDGPPKATPPRPPVEQLDQLPTPAWDLIDPDAYAALPSWNGVLKERSYLPVLTSRGCPYPCTYCHNIFGRKVRLRSARSVVSELSDLHQQFGVREFHVLDDVFNIDRERVLRICELIEQEGLRISLAFPNGLRADRMDDEMIQALERAGTYKVNYGFETVVPRLQKVIRKGLDLERAKEVIEATSRTSIITGAYFMLGLPGETRQEMRKTVEYAVTSGLDVAYFFKATAYPGSEFTRQVTGEDGAGDGLDEAHFYSTERSHGRASVQELNQLLLEAQGRFFLRWGRMWRVFRKWPHKGHFLRSMVQAAALLLQGHLVRRLMLPAPAESAGPER